MLPRTEPPTPIDSASAAPTLRVLEPARVAPANTPADGLPLPPDGLRAAVDLRRPRIVRVRPPSFERARSVLAEVPRTYSCDDSLEDITRPIELRGTDRS